MTRCHNRFRLTALLLIAAALCCTLAGCRTIIPATAEDFETAMKTLDYQVTDTLELYGGDPTVLKSASVQKDGFFIEFLVFNSEQSAGQFYESVKQQYINRKSGVSSVVQTDLPEYSFYKLKSGDQYSVVQRVSDTVFCGGCSKADADRINEALKAIGY